MEELYLIAGIKDAYTSTLKPIQPQRRNEICSSVMVAKAEKMNWMAYGEIKALLLEYNNVLSVVKWEISSEAPNRGTFND